MNRLRTRSLIVANRPKNRGANAIRRRRPAPTVQAAAPSNRTSLRTRLNRRR